MIYALLSIKNIKMSIINGSVFVGRYFSLIGLKIYVSAGKTEYDCPFFPLSETLE